MTMALRYFSSSTKLCLTSVDLAQKLSGEQEPLQKTCCIVCVKEVFLLLNLEMHAAVVPYRTLKSQGCEA